MKEKVPEHCSCSTDSCVYEIHHLQAVGHGLKSRFSPTYTQTDTQRGRGEGEVRERGARTEGEKARAAHARERDLIREPGVLVLEFRADYRLAVAT